MIFILLIITLLKVNIINNINIFINTTNIIININFISNIVINFINIIISFINIIIIFIDIINIIVINILFIVIIIQGYKCVGITHELCSWVISTNLYVSVIPTNLYP